jgi:hypothetical protein
MALNLLHKHKENYEEHGTWKKTARTFQLSKCVKTTMRC